MFGREKELTVNEGINMSRTVAGARLVDCRNKEEFKKYHVPGAVSVPANNLDTVKLRIPSMDTPMYIYGSYEERPKPVVRKLKKMGYTDVHSCGCIEEHSVRPQ